MKYPDFNSISGLIFDLDGVITRTADLHARAWKQMFDAYLERRQNRDQENQAPFDLQSDYQSCVDGKPRYEGVRSFLESRDIHLPDGDPGDTSDRETVCGLGNWKNELFHQLLRQEGVEVYSEAVDQIRRWRAQQRRTAVVSSSRNCRAILEVAGLEHLFDARVDGQVGEELDLSGKPAPDYFLEAARRIEVAPADAAVFEDAVAGVQAARRGEFALVVGVARQSDGSILTQHGADIVINDLAQLDQMEKKSARGSTQLPSALHRFSEIKGTLHGHTPIILLDFDGTLAPITRRPGQARMSEEMRSVLQSLSKACTTAVVSGRDRKDVADRVGVDGLIYAGSHGLDIAGPDNLEMQPEGAEEARPELGEARTELRAQLENVEGIEFENKAYSVAIHYRNVSESNWDEVAQAVANTVSHHDHLRRSEGKRVWEIRPDIDWDKGRAVKWMMDNLDLNSPDYIPIYIGDDTTDEDAFRALAGRGIGIRVGHKTDETAAIYGLQDPDEVRELLCRLESIRGRDASRGDWELVYDEWVPEKQPLREALCTLGNGVFATRGAAEEASAGGVHYPGTYLACGYNRAESEIGGRIIENEDLVNWPNWLGLTFRIANGPWLRLEDMDLEAFRQSLDMKRGILTRSFQVCDHEGRRTTVTSRRFVHMRQPWYAGIQWKFKPENWSGQTDVRSSLDGRVTNAGVKRYRDLTSEHLAFEESGMAGEDGVYLVVHTRQSRVRMAQAARTRVFLDGEPAPLKRETHEDGAEIAQLLRLEAEEKRELCIEKVVAVNTSRDVATSECVYQACTHLRRAAAFDELLADHTRAWGEIWSRCDIEFEGDDQAQRIMRLHIFHLMQTVSMNSVDRDVGVPARGWHGEAYRGHIFWDELFIFPFLMLRVPEIARTLLMYRYRRLPEARFAAREAGYRGAMFPWQSGSDGREESQVIHLNPRSGNWIPDNTHLQRHVNGAIAYNVWKYYQATEDREFLSFYGAEILLDIAQFWSTIAQYNPDRDRYEIRNVVGPDEYHTSYPDSDEPGLSNNAYTNVLAAWTLQVARDVLDLLADERRQTLLEDLGITHEDVSRWETIGKRMYIPFHDEEIISQFEGYEKLEEFDWEGYRGKYHDIQRLDRVLEAEDDTPNRYKAGKQADVLMLFYLFSSDELKQIMQRLGYAFDPKSIPRIVDYYASRTSHGSTLSRVIHSWVFSRSDRCRSWRTFREALMSDVSDIQGGTTPEGIHLGAMAGTVDLMQRCYLGIEMHEDVLWLNPRLPDVVSKLAVRVRYRGHWLRISAEDGQLGIEFERGREHTVKVGIRSEVYTFKQGQRRKFDLKRPTDK